MEVTTTARCDAIREALSTDDLDGAQSHAHDWLKRMPDDAEALHWHGVAQLVAGNLEAAVTSLRRAVALSPDDPRYLNNLAEVFRRSGDFFAAEDGASRALAIDPDYFDARITRIATRFALERFDDALDDVDDALRNHSDDAMLLAYRGDCLRELGSYREACRAYRRALQRDGNLVHAHANLGPLLLRFGETEKARAHCERAVDLDRSSAIAWMNLAHCHIELECLDDAMEAYAEAYERDPQSCELCCAIGQVWREVGDFEQAAIWFERAYRNRPESRRVKTCLAELLVDTAQQDQAIAVYRELLAEKPDDVAALVGLARASWDDSDADAALAHYRRAVALRPQAAQIHCHIADVLISRGELADAERHQRAALAINPRCVAALAGLATTLRGKLPLEDARASEKLLTQRWLRDGARSSLHSGLAHYYDAIGDFSRASQHAMDANRLYWSHRSRRGWRYEPDEHAAHVDRIVATFTPELFARLSGCGNDDARPVFVVGMPRSGTTLTERMLASHPSILGIGERSFAARSVQQVSANHSPLAALARIEPSTLQRVANDYARTLDELAKKVPHARIERIVDKMPDNYELLGWIALLFPNARIVHVRRDARDIAVSCWMQRFGQIRWACDMRNIAERLVQHRRVMAHWRTVLPIRIYEFDYETLVADFETTSRDIVDAIGVPWASSCLAYATQEGCVRTASVSQVRKPIYRTSVARWKHYEDVLSPVLERLQYLETTSLRT